MRAQNVGINVQNLSAYRKVLSSEAATMYLHDANDACGTYGGIEALNRD